MRILIVEDNVIIASNLYEYLEGLGHSIDSVGDGAKGFQLASSQVFDAILLDLSLPGMDGLVLCRRLREEIGADTPILMATARDTLNDKLMGFDSGADDYLIKPFALEEVAARLNALHKRRSGRTAGRKLQLGDLEFDAGRLTASFGGKSLVLPPKCLRLLGLLISDPGRLFSRREIEIELWGEEQDTSERLRHHLHLLRRQLEATGGQDLIKTVHGLGYRLEVSA